MADDHPTPSKPSPGDPSYRNHLTPSLVLRWGQPEDLPGALIVSALAFGCAEGAEEPRAVRMPEWSYWRDGKVDLKDCAMCVDVSDDAHPFAITPRKEGDKPEGEFVRNTREKAQTSKEKVVALVKMGQMDWFFEGGQAKVGCGKVEIVACRIAYRSARGVMKSLMEMVHDRFRQRGDVLSKVVGIPAYYRVHGYEYAVRFGRGWTTRLSDIKVPAPDQVETKNEKKDISDPASSGKALLLDQATGGVGNLSVSSQGVPVHPPASLLSDPPKFVYKARPVRPADMPRLMELNDQLCTLPSTTQWLRAKEHALAFGPFWFGHRDHPFNAGIEGENGKRFENQIDLPGPSLVLERFPEGQEGKGKIVAGIGSWAEPEPDPQLMVGRLVWDLEDEELDLKVVTKESAVGMVGLIRSWEEERYKDREEIKNGKDEDGSTKKEKVKIQEIAWAVTEQNKFMKSLESQGMARVGKSVSLYGGVQDWSIRIPSLSAFLTGLIPALQTRLSSAHSKSILGPSPTFSVRIACYAPKYKGAVINIVRGKVVGVEEKVWDAAKHYTREGSGDESMGAEKGMNVVACYQVLVGLVMGYKTWQEFKNIFPDTQIHPSVLDAWEILFPKADLEIHAFF